MRTIRGALSSKERYAIKLGGGRTKQSFKKDCDINLIMAKYQKTGAISHFQKHSGSYDFASGIDFKEAMDVVAEGRSVFADLPSSIRTRFSNDPAEFLDFCQDTDNAKEMASLGLTEGPYVEPDPPVAEVQGDSEAVQEDVPADSQSST